MKPAKCLTFPALSALPGFNHCFVLRSSETPVDGERAEVLTRLRPVYLETVKQMGHEAADFCEAEQVHGPEIAIIESIPATLSLGADGLVTQNPKAVLGIYVADCCAVYLADPVTKAFGVVHAGRKGAELGIVKRAIEIMALHFNTRAANVIVQLSPCIRPPDYEVDFAAQVRDQCIEAGILPEHLHDCGQNTAADLKSFYSYRIEKGKTGRMLALLCRNTDEG
jgi:polyphenol oxidase